ncbi:MAG: hypothetical protein WC279_04900 [Sulfurimonas sp.]|jgi:hypothetical protein|uniref:hypothetical protein n=1 Tax=unclassified Sulfurimonas TaxID=2623549 RepID=UPI000B24D7D8|nr:hypothetical protein [Sulfurimonas sp. RIFOXYB12_FULL_35_9]
MEDKTITSADLPKVISGIDTLFYFYESNDLYDDFFLDILDQLEDSKGRFEKREIAYSNKDLKIAINNQVFEFNGKAQGFYWFTNLDNFLTVGFKDSLTNRSLNDIQVQFNAVGIYTLGIKALLRYTDDIFKEVTTGYKPVTRVDLNMFVQANLSWLEKDMFVSRKRIYTTHLKEISSKYRLQTLYIGKAPFLLRLYDKKEELKTSKKSELMYEYFLNNGFTKEDDIFNIEFEMHRKHLKAYNIDTVDDLLGYAQKLFRDSMDAIRLVDLSTITENSINSQNRYKAEIHPLWKYFSDSYELKDFLALDMPLERLKRKNYSYTIEDAIKEQVSLARKAYVHNIVIDERFYEEVLEAYLRSREPKYLITSQKIEEEKKELVTTYETLSESINLKELDDLELEKYIKMLDNLMTNPNSDLKALMKKHELAFIELKCRGKSPYEDFPF